MNHSGRKMYQGSVLMKPEKTWKQVMGLCILVPMLVGMAMIFLAM